MIHDQRSADKMKWILTVLLFTSSVGLAEPPPIANSESPDDKFYAIMDIDRDPTIVIEGKEDSWPKIEITERATGKVCASISYFGDLASDARPLREHVKIFWRADSKAIAITIHDRFYSMSQVYSVGERDSFSQVLFPSYSEMTGFPSPDPKDLRPRGREIIEGWDSEGRLIYEIFASPVPTYSGDDPLQHRILLEVTPSKMIPIKQNKVVETTAGLRPSASHD